MDKILCSVLREAHERQVEETMGALEDGPERFYGSHLTDFAGHSPPGSRTLLPLYPI